MTMEAAPPAHLRRKLLLIYLSRFGTAAATTAYAGSLSFIQAAWHMTSAEAGAVQSAYNIGYGLSLFLASWLADRIGAKKVFLASAWCTAVAFLAFAIGARSYQSGLILYLLVAIAQGGTYTPSLMLVAEAVPAARRGRAIGWTLGVSSLGYMASILVSVAASSALSYRVGFYIGAVGPLIGGIAGWLALRRTPNAVQAHEDRGAPEAIGVWQALLSRQSVLLTLGYTAHCWELLGMFAWTPAFLTTALQQRGPTDPVLFGLWIAVPIHLAGFTASLAMGEISDRLGRRAVLIAMAIAGAAMSFAFGWMIALAPAALLAFAFAYNFAALGDSGVISTAMTESVPPRHLGSMLALRSILGYGAGTVAPLAFGWIRDLSGGSSAGWGWAFAALGLGGALAACCALALPKASLSDRRMQRSAAAAS